MPYLSSRTEADQLLCCQLNQCLPVFYFCCGCVTKTAWWSEPSMARNLRHLLPAWSALHHSQSTPTGGQKPHRRGLEHCPVQAKSPHKECSTYVAKQDSLVHVCDCSLLPESGLTHALVQSCMGPLCILSPVSLMSCSISGKASGYRQSQWLHTHTDHIHGFSRSSIFRSGSISCRSEPVLVYGCVDRPQNHLHDKAAVHFPPGLVYHCFVGS